MSISKRKTSNKDNTSTLVGSRINYAKYFSSYDSTLIALRNIRRLWLNQIFLTRLCILEKIYKYPGVLSSFNHLLANQMALSENLAIYFNNRVGIKFNELLNDHMNILGNIINFTIKKINSSSDDQKSQPSMPVPQPSTKTVNMEERNPNIITINNPNSNIVIDNQTPANIMFDNKPIQKNRNQQQEPAVKIKQENSKDEELENKLLDAFYTNGSEIAEFIALLTTQFESKYLIKSFHNYLQLLIKQLYYLLLKDFDESEKQLAYTEKHIIEFADYLTLGFSRHLTRAPIPH